VECRRRVLGQHARARPRGALRRRADIESLYDADDLLAKLRLRLRLAAEIWSYTPETRVWERVFKSPEDVPIGGVPQKFTARDIGFRGAVVFTEPGGVEALYVAGVSASSLFEGLPRWAGDPQGYPPPRILRSVDGVSWQPVPQ